MPEKTLSEPLAGAMEVIQKSLVDPHSDIDKLDHQDEKQDKLGLVMDESVGEHKQDDCSAALLEGEAAMVNNHVNEENTVVNHENTTAGGEPSTKSTYGSSETACMEVKETKDPDISSCCVHLNGADEKNLDPEAIPQSEIVTPTSSPATEDENNNIDRTTPITEDETDHQHMEEESLMLDPEEDSEEEGDADHYGSILEQVISNYLQTRTVGSPFFQAHPGAALPVFDTDEITLGRLLGQGEFGTVREVIEVSDKAGHSALPKLLRKTTSLGASFNCNHNNTSSTRSLKDSTICDHSTKQLGEENCNSDIDGGASCNYYDEVVEVADVAKGNTNTNAGSNNNDNNNNNNNNHIRRGNEDDESLASLEVVDIAQAVRARKVLKRRCWRDGKARYAVKQLRHDIVGSERKHGQMDAESLQLYTIGLMDLAMEARLLASLSHPNICKLRGTAGVPGQRDYMLVLDRLYLTLEGKIEEWREELPQTSRIKQAFSLGGVLKITRKLSGGPRKASSEGTLSGDQPNRTLSGGKSSKSKANLLLQKGQLLNRLYAAYDVARALKYLHKHNIVYRDVKPQNIAFDIRGDVRIFDFGLAKEFVEADRADHPESYNATGMTGSRRWMAPECYFSEPYGLDVDVYSYGLLLWNLCYLRTPFGEGLTCNKLHKHVMVKGLRPKRLHSRMISDDLWSLMTMCWSRNREYRPTFEIICEVLRKEITGLRLDIQMSSPVPDHLTSGPNNVPTTVVEATAATMTTSDGSELRMSSVGVQTFGMSSNASSSGTSSFGRRKLMRKGSLKTFFGGNKYKQNAKSRGSSREMKAVNMSFHGNKLKKQQHKQRGALPQRNTSVQRQSFIDKLMNIRSSKLEDRSDYLMNKSLQSLQDLQISSGNLLGGSSLGEISSRTTDRTPSNGGVGFSQRLIMFGESFRSLRSS